MLGNRSAQNLRNFSITNTETERNDFRQGEENLILSRKPIDSLKYRNVVFFSKRNNY